MTAFDTRACRIKTVLETCLGPELCLLVALALSLTGVSVAQADVVLIDNCRLLDTRQQGQGPSLTGQTTRMVTVRGNCGIPAEATGIEYNATIVRPDAPGYVTLYPSDIALPTTASLNFWEGAVLGNGGVAKLDAKEPSLSVYLATSPPRRMADLVVDVTGYHVPSRADDVATRLMVLSARHFLQSSDYPTGATVSRWGPQGGDGTVTDRLTGLQWELKTDDGSIHDKDNTYTWSTGDPWDFDGTAKTAFLDVLNDVSGGGASCFAGHCDWRLPTVDELMTLIEPAYPDCGDRRSGCTRIPGGSARSFYWSSSEYHVLGIWGVYFQDGDYSTEPKTDTLAVRAVRSGS